MFFLVIWSIEGEGKLEKESLWWVQCYELGESEKYARSDHFRIIEIRVILLVWRGFWFSVKSREQVPFDGSRMAFYSGIYTLYNNETRACFSLITVFVTWVFGFALSRVRAHFFNFAPSCRLSSPPAFTFVFSFEDSNLLDRVFVLKSKAKQLLKLCV